ncbi:MAG: GntR family transcriptional regulator [Oscillospiraceae bacterium]
MQHDKIQNVLLKDQIYEYIIEMIQSGAVEPGQKLAEQSICDILGVSRTPVREALTRLAAEGVIDKTPRRGFSVRAASRKEKEDTYIVLYTLELLAAKLFMEVCTEDMLEELERCASHMDEALEARDFTQYIQINNQAHYHVVDNCRNGVLINTIRTLYMSPVPTYYEDRSEAVVPILRACVEEHREMIRCLREKDTAGLEKVYYEHLIVDKFNIK